MSELDDQIGPAADCLKEHGLDLAAALLEGGTEALAFLEDLVAGYRVGPARYREAFSDPFHARLLPIIARIRGETTDQTLARLSPPWTPDRPSAPDIHLNPEQAAMANDIDLADDLPISARELFRLPDRVDLQVGDRFFTDVRVTGFSLGPDEEQGDLATRFPLATPSPDPVLKYLADAGVKEIVSRPDETLPEGTVRVRYHDGTYSTIRIPG